MKISELLTPELIIPDLKGTSKEDVIDEMIALFKNDSRILDYDKIKSAVFEREKIMSTGVGKGFAIPHAKTDGVREIVAGFGKLNNPIDFKALDDHPVNLVFILIGTENLMSPFIKLLSRISRLMEKEEFRRKLSNAASSGEIFNIFREEESSIFNN